MDKPNTAKGYPPDQLKRVRATCLYAASVLGDLRDEFVVVGGLVPALLVGPKPVKPGNERHVGTMDLDLGLAIAILDRQKYQAFTERLREAGFRQDRNEAGRGPSWC